MRVLVTGGTGFTGRRIVRRLLEAGHRIRCLVRPTGRRAALDGLDIEWSVGDLGDPDSLSRALEGVDALMNVASIGFGHGPGIVRALESAGVGRAVFFSTTAVFTSLPAPSRAVRLRAEEAIRSSSLDWTILRPTMIYGAPGDRNIERLLGAAARRPAIPVVGDGSRKVQPVVVSDLAGAAAAALATDGACRRAYELPGREPLSFRALVEAAFRAVGRRPRVIRVPPALAVGAARIYEAVVPRPLVKAEQVLRLLEDKDFDWSRAARDLGYDPTGAEEGLTREARLLGIGGGR